MNISSNITVGLSNGISNKLWFGTSETIKTWDIFFHYTHSFQYDTNIWTKKLEMCFLPILLNKKWNSKKKFIYPFLWIWHGCPKSFHICILLNTTRTLKGQFHPLYFQHSMHLDLHLLCISNSLPLSNTTPRGSKYSRSCLV